MSTIPNHVRNVVKIKGIPKDKIEYMLNKLAVKYIPLGKAKEEWIIDFDLIIPEPRYKSDCPKECIVNKDSHIAEDKDRPWFDWYRWHLACWGTKWNAYDGYTIIGKTQLTFVFNTAWNTPGEIYAKLCMLGYDIEIRYADEDIGSNCGIIKYDASEEELTHQTESDILHPDSFANYIWNKY